MTQQTSPSDVARIFDAEVREDEPFVPSYNVAPTDPVTVVLQRDDGRAVERHRWGLIPAWANDPRDGARMINARAETVETSPAFRVAFRKRRCIVPADGFYEWQRRDGKRQPWFIHPSCSVVTTRANDQMASLHDRMPVILERDAWWHWLDPAESDLAFLQSLLEPAPDDSLALYPVSTRVNSVRNNGPELIEPLVSAAAETDTKPHNGQQTLFG